MTAGRGVVSNKPLRKNNNDGVREHLDDRLPVALHHRTSVIDSEATKCFPRSRTK